VAAARLQLVSHQSAANTIIKQQTMNRRTHSSDPWTTMSGCDVGELSQAPSKTQVNHRELKAALQMI